MTAFMLTIRCIYAHIHSIVLRRIVCDCTCLVCKLKLERSICKQICDIIQARARQVLIKENFYMKDYAVMYFTVIYHF